MKAYLLKALPLTSTGEDGASCWRSSEEVCLYQIWKWNGVQSVDDQATKDDLNRPA